MLHGDIVQAQREVTMQAFRDGKFNNLVATDVAARGANHLDIQQRNRGRGGGRKIFAQNLEIFCGLSRA